MRLLLDRCSSFYVSISWPPSTLLEMTAELILFYCQSPRPEIWISDDFMLLHIQAELFLQTILQFVKGFVRP